MAIVSDSRPRYAEARVFVAAGLPVGRGAGSVPPGGLAATGGIGFRGGIADDGARRVRTAGEKAIKLGINFSRFPT